MDILESEFQRLDEGYAGYCIDCDEVTKDSGVEPDAEDYRCPKCNNDGVIGMQQALIMGYVSIVSL